MADLALLILTLFWGTTFHFVKGVLSVASPGVFLAARFGVAAALLAAVALVRRDRVGAGLLRHGGLLGVFMLAGFVLQTVGLNHTTPSRSGFLTGLAVLIVPFVARFLLGRRVKLASWAGVALAVAGLGLLTHPFGEPVDAGVRLGDLLTAACAVAFALQIVYTSEWSPRHPVVPLTLVQIAVTFLGAAAMLPFEARYYRPEGAAVFAGTVVFTGVLMTALAFFVQNWGQRHTTAVRAALIFSLEPVAAALFSHFYGGEPLRVTDWSGGALIVLGVIAGEVGGLLEGRRGAGGAAVAAQARGG
ncbi:MULTISPECIES: DMT family transporter [Anaeromyxobacter]|uniref:DMT family transporter n=1 Tax=Anaeromyxobacter TaxID=161492 RepID=UPI001F5687AB|nr:MULTISPECIES: DMT family transporter [unclassified Anaeromyxobacter]